MTPTEKAKRQNTEEIFACSWRCAVACAMDAADGFGLNAVTYEWRRIFAATSVIRVRVHL